MVQLGQDIYAHSSNTSSFTTAMYNELLTTAAGKPIAWTEIGLVPDDADVLATQRHAYFLMRGGFEKGGHNTPDALRALYHNPRALTQGDLTLAAAPTEHRSSTSGVACENVPIPSLVARLKVYRAARVCAPADGGAYPLHVLAHGDGGGGPMAVGYHSLQEELASHGLIVALYLSCAFDSECANGEASFLEALKTIEALTRSSSWRPRLLPVPFSASGHSTGARAVLMLAALRDSPAFLANSSLGSQVTDEHRRLLANLAAVVADHPDPMDDPKQDPDRPHYHVSATAVLVVTGSRDLRLPAGVCCEPRGSGWADFRELATPDKAFVDIAGAGHLQPIGWHPEGPFIAYFAQAYAQANATAEQLLFGDAPSCMRHVLPIAAPPAPNLGDGKVGFLGCRRGQAAVPPEWAAYC